MAETPVSVDGLTPQPVEPLPPTPPSAPTPAPQQMSDAAKKIEKMLLMGAGIAYALYILWSFALMAILPSSDQAMRSLVLVGLLSMAIGGFVFVIAGAALLMRIAQSHVVGNTRQNALIRLVIFVIPGLILSAFTAFMISREPGISIDITKPTTSQEMVAPVSMNFSVEKAVAVLATRGFRPVTYKWDLNGDRKADQETVVPTLTATYDREGAYTLSVTMTAADGSTRTAGRRFTILTAVFGVSPSIPIVEKPVVFSIASLVKDPTGLANVQWDFESDGKVDSEGKTLQATYTYFKTGTYTVTVLIELVNKTQATYKRTITVQEPQPLPFPVTLEHEPSLLIGSPPFAALFSIQTTTPVADVQWDFGDGQQGSGMRVAHTFSENGNYAIEAKVRSESGAVATLNTAVQVVDQLSLPDLSFEGSPKPQGDTIQGEVPLTLNLTPSTKTAFVEFNWEAPDATEVGSTKTNLQAIYRRDGTYTLTLVAQDLNNHVLRKTFKVIAKQPSALVSIAMNPETGLAPLKVSFDASETSIPGDDVTGFIWNFGDGTPEVTQGARVTHTYTIPKTYTIGLTVQTAAGKSHRATSSLVVRAPVLLACMTRSKENIQAGSSVQFYSACTTGSPKNYLWDFGDGAQSSDANPVHLYAEPGDYTVKLIIDDGAGHENSTSTSLTVLP
ncbi:PKD domain-containing protein [Candidatus Peribacteria bacterium]|nr:MAG: PKD domain-containing protein [Candidatus Peribacteria bacterium]